MGTLHIKENFGVANEQDGVSNNRKAPDSPQQILLFGNALPNAAGQLVLTAIRPADANECNSEEAARILRISKSRLHEILNDPDVASIIKWRWLTPARGKRLFEVQSLHAYREASKDSEFGC